MNSECSNAAGSGSRHLASQSGAIIHSVFFWLNNPGSREDRDELVSGLRNLANIDVVRSLRIGLPASTEARDVVDGSFDVSELMLFDSVEDQKTYQDHPLHAEFVSNCQHLWRKVVVYDVVTI